MAQQQAFDGDVSEYGEIDEIEDEETVAQKMIKMVSSFRSDSDSSDGDKSKVNDPQESTPSLMDFEEELTTDYEEDIIELKSRLDAAHVKEQDLQENVSYLKKQLDKLNAEMERSKEFDAEIGNKLATSSFSADDDKEKLLEQLKQALEESEKIKSERDDYLNMYKTTNTNLELARESLNMKVGEVIEMDKLNRVTQKELSLLREKFEKISKQQLKTLKELKDTQSMLTEEKQINENTSSLLSEAQVINEEFRENESKLNEELFTSRSKFGEMQDRFDGLNTKYKEQHNQLNKIRKDIRKTGGVHTSFLRRIRILDTNKKDLEEKIKRLTDDLCGTDRALTNKTVELQETNKKLELLNAEKSLLAKHILNATHVTKEQTKQIKAQSNALRTMESDATNLRHDFNQEKKSNEQLRKQNDKLSKEKSDLASKVAKLMGETEGLKKASFDIKKEMEKKELRIKKEQEALNSTRDMLKLQYLSIKNKEKLLKELQEKLQIVNFNVDRLKTDMFTKDVFLSQKQCDIKQLQAKTNIYRQTLTKREQEINLTKKLLNSEELEKHRLEKHYNELEKGMIVTQRNMTTIQKNYSMLNCHLDRRTTELNLLYEKSNLMKNILIQGEKQYNERLEDIRLLKTEIRKLRSENEMLVKAFNNMSDLRHEVYHLNKDLAEEKQKCRALQEEMETPVNYHRWRQLEGVDPDKKELIDKVRLLQKKLFKEMENMEKEKMKYIDLEELYNRMKKHMETLPGQEVSIVLEQTRKALRNKIDENKVFAAELSAYESLIQENKFQAEQFKKEILKWKKKYYDLKADYNEGLASIIPLPTKTMETDFPIKKSYLDSKELPPVAVK